MNKQQLHRFVNQCWYRKTTLSYLLLPFSILYCWIVTFRRFLYRKKILSTKDFNVLVIVVGNITVGGTGKTPFVIWLANLLKQKGYRPGIVSRGYGGHAKKYPLSVTAQSEAAIVGDEPILIARNTQCPIIVAPDRVAAVEQLLKKNQCDVVISDDGLQHYALGRNFEIVIIDGERRLGNGFCLPAGPLREPKNRLQDANIIICNGQPQFNEKSMKLIPGQFHQIDDHTVIQNTAYFKNKNVHAVAAIGNPYRFFNLLRLLGIDVIEHVFPDHYIFQKQDLLFSSNAIVIMTEKDAVKCEHLNLGHQYWYLPVKADVSATVENQILNILSLQKI